ncbi:MAG: acylneuraminate cytidylyltransferase family protein [Actinomycetes bacterium]
MTVVSSSTTLAIIPARGGSKGVPRKNLVDVAGRPLLAWTVDAVHAATAPIRCVVSTDDDEIADLALQLGSEVVFRPTELSSDESPTEPALLHVLETLPDAENTAVVVMLQATSPIRLRGTLDRALRMYSENRVSSVVGVVSSSPFLWRGPIGSPSSLYDHFSRPRRQDLGSVDLVYRETGSLYVTSAQALLRSGNRISGDTSLFVMDDVEGLDVDTYADLAEAERLLTGRACGT